MTCFHTPDELLERISALNAPYHERGFLFVLAALEYSQRRRIPRGHISGPELARACRDFAIDQFGLMARSVLEYWGIVSTEDMGRIVFYLIEVGLLMKQDTDRVEDFEAVFQFDQAFDGEYQWLGLRHALKST